MPVVSLVIALVGYWLPYDELASGHNAWCYAGKSGLLLPATGVVPNVSNNMPPVFLRSSKDIGFTNIARNSFQNYMAARCASAGVISVGERIR